MTVRELETTRVVTTLVDSKRVNELEKWFRYEYQTRLNKVNRDTYLGVTLEETRYELELEAYNKENELRLLRGLPALPEIKYTNIF